MTKLKLILITFVANFTLQGCSVMTPIGKEDFACPNEKKGGVCAGPRTIYELTNTRPNLENLDSDENYDGYVIQQDEDGNSVAVKNTSKTRETDKPGNADFKDNSSRNTVGPKHTVPNDVVYQARNHTQQAEDNYQPPAVIPQLRTETSKVDPFRSWPTTTEPLAPEPLSVLEPPKVMRILLNSYKDEYGNLHMPGYLYVQVESETWSVGEAALMRPQRVIPTQIKQQAQQENANRKYRQQGVSAIEHQETGNGG